MITETGEVYTPHGYFVADSFPLPEDSVFETDLGHSCKNADSILFSVEHDYASLKINNTRFENWMFQMKSLIHIYKGEVILTDVDFKNTHANIDGMDHDVGVFEESEVRELGSTDKQYHTPGIITAKKRDLSSECQVRWQNDEESNWPRVPAPCGRFVWNDGIVHGHNIDMNPYQNTGISKFAPFLNLNRLHEVHISGIYVTKNFMINSLGMPSLFTI